MSEKEYNGFRNYETWAAALWLGNEYNSYHYWRTQAGECWEEAEKSTRVRSDDFTQAAQSAVLLAERLSTAIGDAQPLRRPSLYTDLLLTAIAEIDWYGLAEHLLADVVEFAANLQGQQEGGARHD